MAHDIFRVLALATGSIILTACDVAYPVAVVGQDGTVFRGVATDTVLNAGQFHATNGVVTCTGRFSRQVDITNASFPVRCSNGLTGIGTASFESHTKGVGTVRMTDGSEWKFIFGAAAGQI